MTSTSSVRMTPATHTRAALPTGTVLQMGLGGLLDCQGRALGWGASRRVMLPIMAKMMKAVLAVAGRGQR